MRDERAPVQAHRGRLAVRARAALREVALSLARQPPARVHAQLALDPALQALAGAPARRPAARRRARAARGSQRRRGCCPACAPPVRARSATHAAWAHALAWRLRTPAAQGRGQCQPPSKHTSAQPFATGMLAAGQGRRRIAGVQGSARGGGARTGAPSGCSGPPAARRRDCAPPAPRHVATSH